MLIPPRTRVPIVIAPYPSWPRARRRLKMVDVTSPKTIPARIDSTGKPGIRTPLTLEVVVVVAVPVRSPPNGEKRRIADSSPPGMPDGIVANVLAEPTVQPLLGEVM